MLYLNKLFKNKGPVSVILAVVISVFFVVSSVSAVTIISTNISTTGNLTVGGTSSMATTTFSGDINLGLKELKSAVLEKLASFPSSPVEGQMFWSTASSTSYWYTGSQWKGDVSGATFVVAASDSKNKEKADYIADGTADDVEIQAALDALPSGGGKVQLLEGTYTITATITTTASSTLSGVGWGTVLDVSGMSNVNTVTMGDNTTLSDLKIIGDISTLDTMGRKVLVGNNSSINNIWIDNNNYGIDTVNKNNVHINNTKFTNIRSTNGWAAALHSSGTSRDIFIDGVYISDSDRGIEVEDGASNVFASNGAMYNVYPTSGNQDYTFTLDVHAHENTGGVDNVVYSNFYLENSGGLTVARSTGSNESDIPTNITYRNITINNPWTTGYRGASIGGRNVTLTNIKFYNLPSDLTMVINILNTAENINMNNIEISDLTASNANMIYITSGASNINISNIKGTNFRDRVVYIGNDSSDVNITNGIFSTSDVTKYAFSTGTGVKNLSVSNVKITNGKLLSTGSGSSDFVFEDLKMDGFQSGILSLDPTSNNIRIENSTFTSSSTFTGNYNLDLRGSNIVFSNNTISNVKTGYGAVQTVSGSTNITLENNHIEIDDSDPSTYALYLYGNNVKVFGNTITGNAATNQTIQARMTSGIIANNYLENDGISMRSNSTNIDIYGNNLENGTFSFEAGVDTNSHRIFSNRGYNTATSSTSMITSGNTFVTATHYLDITPEAKNISVTPTNNMGSATKFWVDNITSSNFRINVDQDPAADATFSWSIRDN